MVLRQALISSITGALVSTSLASWIPPSQRPHGGGSCSSDWDCSLGGTCTEGVCACDPWWTGEQCGYLNLKPAASLNNGLQVPTFGSWGGHCAKTMEGKYVALFSFIVGHCTLWQWTTASGIVMAEADVPEGPYHLLDTTIARSGLQPAADPADAVLFPPYAHNAYIYFSRPDQLYLMFHIGSSQTNNRSQWCQQPAKPSSWTNRTLSISSSERRLKTSDSPKTWETPNSPTLPPYAPPPPGRDIFEEDFIGVSTASSPRGPWSLTERVEFLNSSANKWTETVSNPSPFIFPNGTALLFGKGMGCPEGWGLPGAHECLLLFRAPSWRGPYELLTPDHPLTNMEGEDPGIFQDPRGNFHLLNNVNTWHKRCQPGGACGGHAWSRDGLTWSDNLVGAFGPVIELQDGTARTLGYMERPQVYQDETGAPVTFFAGVTGENYADPISWAQPFVSYADLEGTAASPSSSPSLIAQAAQTPEIVKKTASIDLPEQVGAAPQSAPQGARVSKGAFGAATIATVAILGAYAFARSHDKVHNHEALDEVSSSEDEEARDAE